MREGADPQLDRAIQTAMELLAKTPAPKFVRPAPPDFKPVLPEFTK